ncbi:DMT family transporter [Streptomyces atratus]|uniref:DMT family transporter n=1 Tax=Streptomyces atratus TaxID=1893 RepID=UPI002253A709|nr:DMT family transporter [Streptomyces atratus]MCX5346046.1 DMT family transporter [Streptomyces atratus]
MNVLAVMLALLAALANGAASVLQRRAAMEQVEFEAADGRPDVRQAVRRLAQLVRRPFWLAGASALVLSAAFQTGALAVGSLSVVQPLMASELLFTLLLGTTVFHHRPGGRTWMSFLMLAVGLALFLTAAGPSVGEATGRARTWLAVGISAATAVAALTLLARILDGAACAAVLGCATAISFACTAALIKEVTGRIPDGAAAVFATGYLYAMCCAGLLSLLLLQSTLRAGTLAASQPALTLGDALVSVVLGKALFDERIALGVHLLPATLGACLIASGTVGLSLSPAVAGHWDSTRENDNATERARPQPMADNDGGTESR